MAKGKELKAAPTARHHATKKASPARLDREIAEALANGSARPRRRAPEVLAKPSGSARDQQLAEAIDSGSRERAAELYGAWTSQYSNEDRDRVSGLAGRLTAIDRQNGRAAPPVGSSRLRLDQAEQVVRDANSYGSTPRRSHATLKSTVPGIAKWATSAGGTGAVAGKHGYLYRPNKGEYHIAPYTTKGGRHAGYALKYAATGGQPRGGHSGLWHDLGTHRSPASAAKAARTHYARSFE